jgi:hypothetical protein
MQGDFETAGSFFTDAYLAYLMTGPSVPAIPLDFKSLFGHLGLSSLQSAMAVSEARPGGGFSNQMLLEFSEPPKGLFLLSGDSNQPFSIQTVAPADADMVAEMNFNGLAVYTIIRNVVVDFMGPMGEDIIKAQMNQPVFPEGPTLAEIISRLTTRMQFAFKLASGPGVAAPSPLAMLQGNAAVRIANVADLFESLTPILQQRGFVPTGADGSMEIRLPLPDQAQPLVIYLSPVEGSNDLMVCLNEGSREWFLNPAKAIASDEQFLAETAELPASGLSFWYATADLAELQIQQLDAQVAGNERFLPIITALKSLLMNYTGPQAGVSFLEGNAYRVTNFQPTSYKTNIALAGAVIPVSIAASLTAVAEAEAAPQESQDPSPSE